MLEADLPPTLEYVEEEGEVIPVPEAFVDPRTSGWAEEEVVEVVDPRIARWEAEEASDPRFARPRAASPPRDAGEDL